MRELKKNKFKKFREDSDIGLLKAAKARRARKKIEKQECIANAIELAEVRRDIFKNL